MSVDDVFRDIERAIAGDLQAGPRKPAGSEEPSLLPMIISSITGATQVKPAGKPADTGDPGPDGANLDPSTQTVSPPTKKGGVLGLIASLFGAGS